MFFVNWFNFKNVCTHDKISPDKDTSYCPDCGKLVRNDWYITRCSCCGVKLKTISRHDEIQPQYHYCTNCGAKDFYIEKLEKINFIDINYAVLVKQEVEDTEKYASTIQCWQERTNEQQRLLTQYL